MPGKSILISIFYLSVLAIALPIGDEKVETTTEIKVETETSVNNTTEVEVQTETNVSNSSTTEIPCPKGVIIDKKCIDINFFPRRTFTDIDFDVVDECSNKNEIRNMYGDCIDSTLIITFEDSF